MEPQQSVDERRLSFIRSLYGLNQALSSDNPRRLSDARRTLAVLRRSFASSQRETDAYEFVLPYNPPTSEQDDWLLVARLFALHPHANTAPRRTLGEAMRLLATKRPSAKRRFTQLLSIDHGDAMTHYLRQAVQLLRTEDVAIGHYRLLVDLIDMRHPGNASQRVRLAWARDFYQPDRQPRREPTEEPSQPAPQTADAQHQESR
jgi:CRISPR system Cascade subunit CasB